MTTPYNHDLLDMRSQAQRATEHLRSVGVPDHQIRSVLISIMDAGMEDATSNG